MDKLLRTQIQNCHNNMNFSVWQVMRWISGLNENGKSHSPEEWRKLSEAERFAIKQQQLADSSLSVIQRTLRPTDEVDKVIGLYVDGKNRYRKEVTDYSFQIVDVKNRAGDVIGQKIEFSDPKLKEVSAVRAFDKTYEAVKDDDHPLDIVKINEDLEEKKVRWYNGESFWSWYNKPVEERYPLNQHYKKPDSAD